MTARDVAGVVLFAILLIVLASQVSGCLWQGQVKPVAGVYVPSLQPISREALQCLDERTYRDLVQRDLEWRAAYDSCQAVVEELTVRD